MKKLLLPAFMFCASMAQAGVGTIALAWDAATATPPATVAGYRVSYGTATGNYTVNAETPSTSLTVTGLDDCTVYYLAVKAKSSTGVLSAAYSTEISGHPKMRPDPIPPQTWAPGSTNSLALTGANFYPATTGILKATLLDSIGGAGAAQSVPCTVSVGFDCTHVSVTCAIPATAPLGRSMVLKLEGETWGEVNGVTYGAAVVIGNVSGVRRTDK